MPAEFDCRECGNHVFSTERRAPEPPLCCLCLFLPGWFKDPRTREIFDPQHDGREILERTEVSDG